MPFTRFRNRVGDSSSEVYTHGTVFAQNNCTGYNSISGSTKVSTSLSDQMWDCELPGWKTRVARGEIIPTNECKKVMQKVRPAVYKHSMSFSYPCGCIGNGIRLSTGYHHAYFAPFPSAPAIPQEVRDMVESKFPQMLKDSVANARQQELDLLTALAETRKTLNLAADTIRLFVNLFQEFLGKVHRLRRLNPDDVARVWLQARYGIRPVLMDLKAIHNILSNGGLAKRRAIGRSQTQIVHKSDAVTTTIRSINRNVKVTSYLESTAVLRAGALAEMVLANGSIEHIKFNPLATAWELIPYSFVWDWVFDIGNSILAMSDSGLSTIFHDLWTSYSITTRRIIEVTELPPNEYYASVNNCNGGSISSYLYATHSVVPVKHEGSYTTEYQRVRRSMADVSFVPRFKLNFDLKKVADAVALLRGHQRRQLLSGLPTGRRRKRKRTTKGYVYGY